MHGDASPLALAVLDGEAELVLNLINCAVDVNATNYVYDETKRVWRRETALITASRLGHLEIVHHLVEAGAHLDVSDLNLGKSPLHWACNKNHDSIARELISAGASVNFRDYANETAIVEVIACQNEALFNVLLNNGVVLDARLNIDQDTGLLFSLYLGQDKMALSLIQAGADVNCMNSEGMDALHLTLDSALSPEITVLLCRALVAAECIVRPHHLSKAHNTCRNILEDSVSHPVKLTCVCRNSIRRRLRQRLGGTSIVPRIAHLPLPRRLQEFVKLMNYDEQLW